VKTDHETRQPNDLPRTTLPLLEFLKEFLFQEHLLAKPLGGEEVANIQYLHLLFLPILKRAPERNSGHKA